MFARFWCKIPFKVSGFLLKVIFKKSDSLLCNILLLKTNKDYIYHK